MNKDNNNTITQEDKALIFFHLAFIHILHHSFFKYISVINNVIKLLSYVLIFLLFLL